MLKIKYIVFFYLLLNEPLFASIPSECGELSGRKMDYTNIKTKDERDYIRQAEGSHFLPNVENLIEGNRGSLSGDLHYILESVPNHHRALYSVSRWHLRNMENNANDKLKLSVDCYFIKALTIKPNDSVVWMLYGSYLHRKKEYKKALIKYKKSESLNSNNVDLHYNMGLLYIKLEDYDKASKHAKKAYKLGSPFPSLKRQLIKSGVWKK